ncbi:uncharacterized protein SETTUDRAFT_156682 [Exserohilum turcica Et28A]|uniref:Major facilitator superfamily (MFS) profile domain-containing protein n=1 Tax=Exserohilum turcicum (strain 28A) TaxID=671987 RepID=R0K011_EXST2|nr:uncharacterized protein SETTUDRAFT_156682 [Exserohilum turcica Et28A]EOA83034.1 hypothetical protein SETTUDRAFT_156682 [Exserohilum turcica Et28A]
MVTKNESPTLTEDVASGVVEAKVHIHARTIVAIAAISFISTAQLMSVVGSGVLARDMATSLGAPSLSAWFGAIITILTLATILPTSQASDYWGRKPFILASCVFGVIGFIVVSRSKNIATCLAGFTLGGMAFACQALCYAIPSEVLHRKHRGYGQASVNISAGLGGLVGIIIGGAFTRSGGESWRNYWYICFALYVLGFVGVFFGYNPPPRELEVTLSTSQKLRKMDWIGSFLIAVGLILFVIGLQWSRNPYPWNNGHVLGPFITGICLLIVFGIWEWKGTNEGILHHSLFKDRNLPVSTLLIFIEGVAFFTVNNFFVFELIIVGHVGAFPAVFRFAVLFAASIVTAFLTGAYITWSKRVREPLIFGFLLLTTFPIVMVFYRENLPAANAYGYAIIYGSGLGLILTATIVAAQMSSPADQISLSSGLPTAARSLGGAVGVAINNAIYNNSLQSKMPRFIAEAVLPLGFNPKDLPALIGALASQNPAAVAAVPGSTPAIIGAASHAVSEAYRLSFRDLWIAAACFGGFAVLLSCLVKNSKGGFTEHIDAPAETLRRDIRTRPMR